MIEMVQVISSDFYSLNKDVDIIVANSAGEAIQLMESSTGLDLVLLDLHMPGLNGLSIIQHHRTQSSCLPIVIISGDDNPDTIKAVLDAGVMGFIPKSFPAKKYRAPCALSWTEISIYRK